MMKTKSIPNILIALLGSLIKDNPLKAAKGSLAPGQIEGEVTLRVPFKLTKGEDYDTAPTVSLLSLPVMAKALVYAGVTAEHFKTALTKAANEALLNGEKVGDKLSNEDERLIQAMEDVKNEVIAQLPRQPRNGSVTVKITTPDGLPEVVKAHYRQVVEIVKSKGAK